VSGHWSAPGLLVMVAGKEEGRDPARTSPDPSSMVAAKEPRPRRTLARNEELRKASQWEGEGSTSPRNLLPFLLSAQPNNSVASLG
jgi:hypothetical protein